MSEVEVRLRIPGPDTPGFLKRATRATQLGTRLERELKKENPSLEIFNDLAEFLSDYLEVPEGVDPKEAVLNLSENELTAAMSALSGAMGDDEEEDEDPPVKKVNGSTSSGSTPEA